MDKAAIDAIKVMLIHPRQAIQRYVLLLEEAGRAREVFFHQEYYWLVERLKPGTTVLVLGANIGDTPIYFSQFKEVRQVIAYEPAPIPYSIMVKNLVACKIKGKVIAINEGLAGKAGIWLINDRIVNSERWPLKSMLANKGKQINVTTLNQALQGLKDVVIECDIEGGEAEIFNDADLSSVYAIMLEWHGTKVKVPLIKILESKGFRVTATSELTYTHKGEPFDETGLIMAMR